jgi:nucleoside-diphosphate-sugar epimerase
LKVLLTGASGFVGSHILDSLVERKLDTAILLRNTSATRFLASHLSATDVRQGSLNDPASLLKATKGVTHVIHCAGCTKALKVSDLYDANHQGTRNLLGAVNAQGQGIRRFLLISSLSVSGPATVEKPANEEESPRPVSDYGKSKLAAELAVKEDCRTSFTIIRPPAVYGPRDTEFLPMFKAVWRHVLPRPSKTQALSLVYAKDLAEGIIDCLLNPVAVGKTYFVASPEIVTGRRIADEIARQMNRWTIPFPMPTVVLWAICLLQQFLSQVTRRASLLNLQKYAELRAPGWVCSPIKLQRETGVQCKTNLAQGIARTLEWYNRQHWL